MNEVKLIMWVVALCFSILNLVMAYLNRKDLVASKWSAGLGWFCSSLWLIVLIINAI